MKVTHFDSDSLLHFEPLISDYLAQKPVISDLIDGFPTVENCLRHADERIFSVDKRIKLADIISSQYRDLKISTLVAGNIESLRTEKTFTVTTGHQLCLFTGPLYFVYKILSTIKLCKQLNEISDKHFVPIYWMASEDHDFEEVNHAYFFQKKLIWQNAETGAVGEMNPKAVAPLLDELKLLFGNPSTDPDWIAMLKTAYGYNTLAEATRFIANELFGRFGLVVLDANEPALKKEFSEILKIELFSGVSFENISNSNHRLADSNYKVHVNPRPINLFYLKKGIRTRIEKINEEVWKAVDHAIEWNREELLSELDQHPEHFSPNVIMRPMYQEHILPNIAYVGGPGEIAYWLQLKANFDAHRISFPLLILRDSVLLINDKIKGKMEKLGLQPQQIFMEKESLKRSLIDSASTTLPDEKQKLSELFEEVAAKMKAIDPTLENAARAEEQRILQSIENLEKKMMKALKTKEEVKLQQLDKLLNDLFPDGMLQERHDNFFQHQTDFGPQLLDFLLDSFDPLKNEFHVIT